MSISNKDIERAILNWISLFPHLSNPNQTLASLSDGIALTEVMCQISPSVFDTSEINLGPSENWEFKLHNLAYLYEGLEEHYTTVLGTYFDKTYVDILKLSKNKDLEQLFNLAELVLGAAVQGDKKDAYINGILTLDEDCQNTLQYLILRILNKCRHIQVVPRNNGNLQGLLKKIEELENENHLLIEKLKEVVQERDMIELRVNELTQELKKKAEDFHATVFDKEIDLEKLRESNEELKEKLRWKDKKIADLTKLVEDTKQAQQMEHNQLHEELEEQKKKLLQLSKLENTLEVYKQKYEDHARLSIQVSELEKQNAMQRNRIEELITYNENLSKKVNIFKEKIESKKNKKIALEVEITRLGGDIETLKNEKKRLEGLTNQYEQKIQEQQRVIEKLEKEQENNPQMISSFIDLDRAPIKGFHDFQDIISNMQKEIEILRSQQNKVGQLVIMEHGETEILKKENEIIKGKCKQIEAENENLRNKILGKEKEIYELEKLNQRLQEQIEELKQKIENRSGTRDKEIEEMLKDEINSLQIKKEVAEKEEGLKKQSKKTTEVENTAKTAQELKAELEKREGQIKQLIDEFERMQQLVEEIAEQKEKELRTLSQAFQELVERNLGLEKDIIFLKGSSFLKENFPKGDAETLIRICNNMLS